MLHYRFLLDWRLLPPLLILFFKTICLLSLGSESNSHNIPKLSHSINNYVFSHRLPFHLSSTMARNAKNLILSLQKQYSSCLLRDLFSHFFSSLAASARLSLLLDLHYCMTIYFLRFGEYPFCFSWLSARTHKLFLHLNKLCANFQQCLFLISLETKALADLKWYKNSLSGRIFDMKCNITGAHISPSLILNTVWLSVTWIYLLFQLYMILHQQHHLLNLTWRIGTLGNHLAHIQQRLILSDTSRSVLAPSQF